MKKEVRKIHTQCQDEKEETNYDVVAVEKFESILNATATTLSTWRSFKSKENHHEEQNKNNEPKLNRIFKNKIKFVTNKMHDCRVCRHIYYDYLI